MFHTIILTTFSVASIFGVNLIYINNDIELSGSLGREYSNRDELNSVEMVDRGHFIISTRVLRLCIKRSSGLINISPIKG